MTSQPSFQIIYLNGPSSSGKSRLAKALQETLEAPFLHIGIDKVIGLMPNKLNNWEGGPAPQGFSWKSVKDEDGTVMHELQMGSFAKKITNAYKEIVVTLARLGHSIIIDDVAFGKDAVEEWKQLLGNYKVMYVGIMAPLSMIEEREKTRGDRIMGSARAQYKKVHEGVTYDLLIDTAADTLENNVKKITSHYYDASSDSEFKL